MADRLLQLRRGLARSEPQRADSYLEMARSMVPAVAGWAVDTPPCPGHSKIGGRPDLPESVAWPRDAKGRARLSFLLQIDMGELTRIEQDSPLPHTGMLYLFALCDKSSAQSYIMDSSNTAVIFIPTPGALQPRDYPESLPPKARLDESRLRFGPSIYLEERVEPAAGDEPNLCDEDGGPTGNRAHYRAKRFDHALEVQFSELLEQCGSHWPDFKLVKQPWFFRDEARMQFDPDVQIELLSFAGAEVSLQYRGCVFHLVIDKSALARGALDQATVIFESGT